MPVLPDHYAILGLDPRADDVVVHAAWRALLRKYHPDANCAPEAAERTHAINQAHEILADPHARRRYDRDRITHVVQFSLSTSEPRRSRRRAAALLLLIVALLSPAMLYLAAPDIGLRLAGQLGTFATDLSDTAAAWCDDIATAFRPARPPA